MYHKLNIPGGDVEILPLPASLSDLLDTLFERLYDETPWEQRYITIYGIDRAEPRLTAWYGNEGYTYSGVRWEPRPWTPLLQRLRDDIQDITGAPYNGVLLNLYKDGRSSIGMHADDEPEFGREPTIASLSLGAERMFDFQRKDKSLPIVKVRLTHGSLLVMRGRTQEFWKHGIAKTKQPVGPRINLTFRNIIHSQP